MRTLMAVDNHDHRKLEGSEESNRWAFMSTVARALAAPNGYCDVGATKDRVVQEFALMGKDNKAKSWGRSIPKMLLFRPLCEAARDILGAQP